MLGPGGFEGNLRVAIGIALVCVIVVAPLLGVYALSPFLFVWGLEPYQLAVAVSVMAAEAMVIAALVFLLRSPRR